MKIDLVNLKKEYETIKEELKIAFEGVFERSDFIFGKDLALFEEEFAKYCGTKYAIGVDSGTGALELALRAVEIKKGDEVIVPVFTFYATAASVCYLSAKPVFVDVEENTGNIDVNRIEFILKKNKKIKAIIPVHLFGQPADMNSISTLLEKYNIKVIEDSAQAHGAKFKLSDGHWYRAGSVGICGCFSFYPAKNLGCYGDGGMVTTNDKSIADKIKLMRDYGRTEKYKHESIGYNKRLDTLQAAILRIKLKYLDERNKKRREIAKQYIKLLEGLPVEPFDVKDDVEPVYHMFVVKVKKRNQLKEYLAKKGISTGIHYPIPLHLQKSFSFLGYKKADFPTAEKLAEEVISLPMYPELQKEEIKYVCNSIKEFYR
ncbi:MAG: DegT/DnrJ/EryC1/StrS family aminotransferase [Endomicrobiia bacterium]